MVPKNLPRRLSAQDAGFLYFERDTAPLHIGSLAIFEGRLDYERFVENLNGRLHLIPRYRQRVLFAPLNLAHPTWEYDPEFDIRRHVRRVSLAAPGSEEQLRALCAELWPKPLDRHKPLWEMILIEGLSGDRTAVMTKVHHCLVDGVSGIDLLLVVLDVSPQPEALPPSPPYAPPPLPSPGELLADALLDQAGEWLRQWSQWQVRLLNPNGARPTRDMRRALELVFPFLAEPAPKTPFNVFPSGERRIAWTDISFSEVRGIRGALGGTVNDVVLAVVAAALGRYLDGHGYDTRDLKLRAMLPVNVRREDELGQLGNRVSALFACLPAGLGNPVERLRAVQEEMARLKRANQASGIETLMEVGSLWPPFVQAAWGLLPFPKAFVNLVCTNVPGPLIPLYSLGHRLLAHYPLVPLGWDLGLGVGITSYDQRLFFGFMADRKAVPDVELLPPLIEESFLELRQAAVVVPSETAEVGRPGVSAGG